MATTNTGSGWDVVEQRGILPDRRVWYRRLDDTRQCSLRSLAEISAREGLVTKHKILLAGGLRPDNVANAIRRVRPWGVDVASGVESESALKDPDAMAHFVAEAHAAAERLTES